METETKEITDYLVSQTAYPDVFLSDGNRLPGNYRIVAADSRGILIEHPGSSKKLIFFPWTAISKIEQP